MKQKKYYVHDGTHCSVEYAADEKEACKKWASRFKIKPSAAAVSCINAPDDKMGKGKV